jgi:sugar phosphate isomerase/epimerase
MKKFPVAVQLYSVRDAMEKDFFGVLKQVKAMGYSGVEFAGYYGHSAAEISKVLKELSLTAVSAHVAFVKQMEDIQANIAFHKELGVKYITIPYLDEQRRPGGPEWPETVKQIRKLGEACSAAGLQLLYHNHDFEFVKIGGMYGLDLLYQTVPMPYLATELDTCWVRVAGVDPCAYLRKYAGRSPVVHLKDFVAGATVSGKPLYALIDKAGKDNPVEVVDKTSFDFRPLGKGVQDIPAILKASEDAGAEWVIVEQDRSTERPSLEAIAMSRDYLKTLGL